MHSSISKTSKAKSASKRWNLYEGRGLVETATVAAQPGAEYPEMQRVVTHGTSTQWREKGGMDVAMANSSGSPNHHAPASRQMFGTNLAISGGHFTQAETVIHNINKSRADSFEILRHRVSPSAFHNSVLRFEPPRCHPNTCVAILQRIYDWITLSEHREKWLLWLNGAAGAGKSAIIQSVAERSVQAAIAIACFFFFRSDPTRNTIAPLVATLVYQLMQVIPETEDDILQAIERNPLIFDQSLESQFQQLLILPLLHLPSHLRRLLVVFIDGLDECNDRNHQSNLVKLFSDISCHQNSPIIFVVSSRREPHIEASFTDRHVYPYLLTIPLDNSDVEQTLDDIRHFLNDKFHDIKETHLRRKLLPIDWPRLLAVDEIVTKSSGQFIYASVAINYISSPRAHPAHQLDIILGLRWRDAASQNPFAHLDALYQHIFSQIEALDKVLDILAFVLITKGSYISRLVEAIFLLEAGELEVYLADLTAVVECKRPNPVIPADIKFLHASLPDFLLDESRSGRFYIDFDEYTPKLLYTLLERAPPIFVSPTLVQDVSRQEFWRLRAIEALLRKVPYASVQLHEAILKFNFTFYTTDMADTNPEVLLNILRLLKQLVRHSTVHIDAADTYAALKQDFGDEGQAYGHVLDIFAVGFARYWPFVERRTDVEYLDILDNISKLHR